MKSRLIAKSFQNASFWHNFVRSIRRSRIMEELVLVVAVFYPTILQCCRGVSGSSETLFGCSRIKGSANYQHRVQPLSLGFPRICRLLSMEPYPSKSLELSVTMNSGRVPLWRDDIDESDSELVDDNSLLESLPPLDGFHRSPFHRISELIHPLIRPMFEFARR